MNFVNKIFAAVIVYRDYCSKGYFSPWNPLPIIAILADYYRLKGEVAFVRNDRGEISGTIMMALDRGVGSIPQLDNNFPEAMAKLRQDFPSAADGKSAIAFCGKLGTKGRGKSSSAALRCFLQVVRFAQQNGTKVILCVMSTDHCPIYIKMGGLAIDYVPDVKGVGAPGHLVKIVLADCPKIMRRMTEGNPATEPTLNGVAA